MAATTSSPSTLTSNTYGKSRVRVVRIDRQPDRHLIFEVILPFALYHIAPSHYNQCRTFH
jgi:hypothetical protein